MSYSKDNFLALISFLISFLIYTIFVFIILFFAYSSKDLEDTTKYTKDKDAYLDIYVMDIDDTLNILSTKDDVKKVKEVDTTAIKEEEVEKESIKTTHKKVDDKEKEKKTIEKKEIVTKEKKEDSLLDLFKNIDTTNLEEQSKKEDRIQSRKKSDKETKTKPKVNTSKQISKNKGDKSSGKSQNTGIYNKFKGEVESTLRNIWSSYRAMPNQDATVEITIDKSGKATYNIIELSYNTEFNQKLRDFLSRIERINFSKPPDGQSYTHKYKMKDLLH